MRLGTVVFTQYLYRVGELNYDVVGQLRAVATAKLLCSSCKADLEGFSPWRGKTAGIVRDREGKTASVAPVVRVKRRDGEGR
jgi:hypothetical protein